MLIASAGSPESASGCGRALGCRVQALEKVELEGSDADAEHHADQPGLLACQGPRPNIRSVAEVHAPPHTRSRVAGLAPGASRITIETSARETWACLATSFSVTRRRVSQPPSSVIANPSLLPFR